MDSCDFCKMLLLLCAVLAEYACVVNFYLLSTEWSKNLFTIIIMDYKTADEKSPRNYALIIQVSNIAYLLVFYEATP